jgi:hypothetical protein
MKNIESDLREEKRKFVRKENDKGKTNITNIILAEQSELVQTDMLAVRP